VRSLRLLSGSTSPLESLLQEVSRQTNLSGADGDGVWAWLKGFFTSKTGIGVTPVDKEFRPLVQFVSGKADASPMAEHRAQLKKVADALNANNKPLSELSKAMQAGDDTIGLRPARQAVADSLEAKGFSSSPASGDAARVLRLPLDTLNTLLVGTDFEQIEKAWAALFAKAQGFEAGFPFADGGSDTSLAALAQFLNPQDGELTRFFQERLKPYFEDDWTVKKEAADKFAPAFVSYLASARRLREALFPDNGRQPKAEYQLTLLPARDALVRVEVDGQLLQTPDKTTANMSWPGDKSGVRITVTPTNGQDAVKAFAGEWGLLRMFRESGGGAGSGATFTLQPAAGVTLSLQPKSGNPFKRELFSALKAPKGVRQ
ncbi:MAG TPA: type VI secretion IcmF C-terminal domain-containing protein, partial [Pyrinomonadaceae bacterium]